LAGLDCKIRVQAATLRPGLVICSQSAVSFGAAAEAGAARSANVAAAASWAKTRITVSPRQQIRVGGPFSADNK